MHRSCPSPERVRQNADERLLSRDEVVGLFVALACSIGCMIFLLSLPTPAMAEESGEAMRLMEGFAEALGEPTQGTASPAPADAMPLIVVAVIMGVALAIAFVVSRSHAKPRKLGGAKGDVW